MEISADKRNACVLPRSPKVNQAFLLITDYTVITSINDQIFIEHLQKTYKLWQMQQMIKFSQKLCLLP